MKNKLLNAILLCSVIMANAQTKYGVQASGVMSSASFSESSTDNIDKDLNAGFAAGVYAEFPLNTKFSIKPGLNFMQKGVKVSNKFTDEGTQYKQNVKANLNYLEVPVLAIYNFKGTDGKWFVGAGPSASYGISGKLKGKINVNDGETSQSESFSVHAFRKENDNGADFKRFDLGAEAVIGHNISKNMAVQVNYIHGLSNIASNSGFDNEKFKNRNMMVSLKYKI
ncbi:MAG: PorT family protein [Bacteroidia bacterium]|nr:PorT family protein [Bacteroidia bacterium]NNL31855.1 PorT family protein [Flavobacteriaceae bacterium]